MLVANHLVQYPEQARVGAVSELHSSNTLTLAIPPRCLFIFKPFNSLKTPSWSTVISTMGVNRLVSFEGISESDSRVKADLTGTAYYKCLPYQDCQFSKFHFL